MKRLIALSGLILALMAVTSTAQGSVSHHRHNGNRILVIRHRRFVIQRYYIRAAKCIHSIEAPTWWWNRNYHPGYSYWNGYYTGLQFAPRTWSRANELLGLHTSPNRPSKLNIILHMKAIVIGDGGSFREWTPDDYTCGLPH